MRQKLEDTPVVWGGMLLNRVEAPAHADFTPLLEGLPDDLCPCPHWGYMLDGALHMRYSDGSEETLEAGQIFYMQPGHTAWTTDQGAIAVIIGPEEEEKRVMAHMDQRQKELGLASS